jgi:tRNA-splicing endonuclease subunit Sen2
MATKRNHAVRKHQYGVPLPLPALQQHQQQLQRNTPSATAQDLSLQQPAVLVNVTCSTWIPFFSIILSILRYLQRQCDIKVPPEQYLIQGYLHFSGSSVWISNSKDMEMLFRQGFFGKGTLSRSEATWKKRSAGNLQGNFTMQVAVIERYLIYI